MFVVYSLDMTTGGDTFSIAGNPLLRTVSEEAMRFTPLNNPKFANFSTFYDKYESEENQYGILGQGSDHTVFAFYVGVAALDTGFGGDTAWGAYHSMYDTLMWQEPIDSDWMLAEDIARFTGVLTLKLLDEIVLPFDLEMFAVTMKEWFTDNLMQAMQTYDCNPSEYILDENVTQALLDSIEEFEDVAVEMNEMIKDLRNRTNVVKIGESDSELIAEFNALLGSIAKEFMHSEGLPQRPWHKNILWNTAIEDGPSNVFPYIWYALQYQCEEGMLRESFQITQSVVDSATETLQMYLGNATSAKY